MEINKILRLVDKFYEERPLPFDKVPVSGKVFDSEELKNLVECALEGWWTEGKWTDIFEKQLREFFSLKHALTVNSGSSANLIAMKTLSSPRLKKRRIKPGDEIITTANGFPTTVNPIIQVGAVPVLVDVDMGTYNVNIDELKKALSSKTKAIFLAHTLGNPFEISKIREICEKNSLWLIEDNCDALGSTYDGKLTGTFGDLSTLSFYPAHHITTAEGGAVLTDDPLLYKISHSIRDWGRDCWCPTGKDDTCKKRYSWKLGDLPEGYDHKYIYSETGYNLKMTDLQASIGVAQMQKLESFIKKRKQNFSYLLRILEEFDRDFILPKATFNSDPSWFGFLLTLKDKSIKRKDLLESLNKNGIATRLLFAGNIIKQPYFADVDFRKVGNLKNTDKIMEQTFWVGVYPALGKRHLDHIHKNIREFIRK